MKAYFSSKSKKYRQGLGNTTKLIPLNVTEKARPSRRCPRCNSNQAFVLNEDQIVKHGDILIHTRQIYCSCCKEVFAVPQ